MTIELFQNVQSNDYGQIACFFGFVFMTIIMAIFALARRWKAVVASFLMGAASAVGSVAFQDRATYYALPDDWRNVINQMKDYAQNDAVEQVDKFQILVRENINSILNEKQAQVVKANLPEACRSFVKN